MYERRGHEVSDSGHGGFDRFGDVCKPAFDRIREDFSGVDERFGLLEHRIDYIREDVSHIKEKLNNGINDKISNTNKIVEGLVKKMDHMVFWILGGAGTIILSAIGIIIMAAAGLLGGG